MAAWLEIDSSHLYGYCGYTTPYYLNAALDGDDIWVHAYDHDHWFIIDLGESYLIDKVRGRSSGWYQMGYACDPTDVNIYVSDDPEDWGDAVATGISTWQDTSSWREVSTTPKVGRYIKIEIVDTEDYDRWLAFGRDIWDGTPFSIFDAYGVPAVVKNFSGTCADWLKGVGTGLTITRHISGTAREFSRAEAKLTAEVFLYGEAKGAVLASGLLIDATIHLDSSENIELVSVTALCGTTILLDSSEHIELVAVSKLVGVITNPVDLFGLATETSSATGILVGTTVFLPSVTVSAQSSVEGDLTVTFTGTRYVFLDGTIVCSSSVIVLLKTTCKIVSAVTCQSSSSATLRATRELTTTVVSQSTTSGSLHVLRGLQVSVAANSAVVGKLAVELIGTITTESTVNGLIRTTCKLVGAITCQSSTSGKLHISLRGRVLANSSVTGSLKVTRELVTSIATQSSLSGVLKTVWSLTCSINPNSTTSGRVSVSRKVTGQISCSSSVVGTIILFKLLVGSVTAHSAVWCSYRLVVSKRLDGRVTVHGIVTGQVTRYKSLTVTIDSVSTLVASLINEVKMVGAISASGIVEAHLVLKGALRVKVRPYSLVSGLLSVGWKLTGTVTAVSTVNGMVVFRVPHFTIADVTISLVFEQTLFVQPTLESAITNQPVLTHTADVLPVWGSLVTGLPILTHATRVNEKLKQVISV